MGFKHSMRLLRASVVRLRSNCRTESENLLGMAQSRTKKLMLCMTQSQTNMLMLCVTQSQTNMLMLCVTQGRTNILGTSRTDCRTKSPMATSKILRGEGKVCVGNLSDFPAFPPQPPRSSELELQCNGYNRVTGSRPSLPLARSSS